MIITFVKKKFAVRNAKDLIRRTKRVLKKNRRSFDSDTVRAAEDQILKSEYAIKNSGLNDIRKSNKSLNEFFDSNLKTFEKSKLRQNTEAIILALGLALLIRTFVVQPFKIPSGSMIPTLLIGDHLLVNKFYYGTKIPFTNIELFPVDDIKRGDVIVFKFPSDRDSKVSKRNAHYIKRVIGIPGDKIDIRGRQLYVNDASISQEYIGDYQYNEENIPILMDKYLQTISRNESHVIYRKGLSSTSEGKLNMPITVPEDNLFVMGDNRDNSYDSRFWGFVPIGNVSGKAFIIHWSWDLSNSNLLNKIRWERILDSIN